MAALVEELVVADDRLEWPIVRLEEAFLVFDLLDVDRDLHSHLRAFLQAIYREELRWLAVR